MLECEFCDYLKITEARESCKAGSNVFACEFTGYIFTGYCCFDLPEYPCVNRSYNEYLQTCHKPANSIKNMTGHLFKDIKKSSKRVYNFSEEFWQYLYVKEHQTSAKR